MPKRAETEIRKRIQASGNQLTIEQLCLDGIQIKTITPTIKRLLESCANIQYLTMNDCQLKSLQNFPHLKNLIGLELSDNSQGFFQYRLSGEDLNKIVHCPSINFLTLDNNRISSTIYLNHLQKLSQLEILQLHNNDICEEENYRENIFEMFPKLQILDCLDKEGNRVREENQSDYISIIGNSRLDILQLLENDDKAKTEDFVKTATEYYDEGPLGRRNSGDTSQASFSSQVSNPISNQLAQGSRLNQIGLVFARTGIASDSSDQDPSDMMKDFKRKLQKKEQ